MDEASGSGLARARAPAGGAAAPQAAALGHARALLLAAGARVAGAGGARAARGRVSHVVVFGPAWDEARRAARPGELEAFVQASPSLIHRHHHPESGGSAPGLRGASNPRCCRPRSMTPALPRGSGAPRDASASGRASLHGCLPRALAIEGGRVRMRGSAFICIVCRRLLSFRCGFTDRDTCLCQVAWCPGNR
jgi:hypothetical protein